MCGFGGGSTWTNDLPVTKVVVIGPLEDYNVVAKNHIEIEEMQQSTLHSKVTVVCYCWLSSNKC